MALILIIIMICVISMATQPKRKRKAAILSEEANRQARVRREADRLSHEAGLH